MKKSCKFYFKNKRSLFPSSLLNFLLTILLTSIQIKAGLLHSEDLKFNSSGQEWQLEQSQLRNEVACLLQMIFVTYHLHLLCFTVGFEIEGHLLNLCDYTDCYLFAAILTMSSVFHSIIELDCLNNFEAELLKLSF